uniref:Uncharacterized protein n=1 Tax=Tetranychus urticae TaxID=32264 RepID=T1KU05_TETUR
MFIVFISTVSRLNHETLFSLRKEDNKCYCNHGKQDDCCDEKMMIT